MERFPGLGDPSTWTYGAEHELGDWDQLSPLHLLLPGFKTDVRDVTMVNTNGIAVDPQGRTYTRGGEVNTPPTDSPGGQVECLEAFLKLHPDAVVNYRSNLHVHVRVPGLSSSLAALKRFAQYNARWLPEVLPIIEPIPVPTSDLYPDQQSMAGAKRRCRRRKVSHHTLISAKRLEIQLQAESIQAFHEAEVPREKATGAPMWHAQARQAVNLRQLKETDTVEFRHFPGTLNPSLLLSCVEWCRDWLLLALRPCEEWPVAGIFCPIPIGLANLYRNHRRLPEFLTYDHAMEVRYRHTCWDGTLSREQIERNTKAILEGTFEPDPAICV